MNGWNPEEVLGRYSTELYDRMLRHPSLNSVIRYLPRHSRMERPVRRLKRCDRWAAP